MQDPYGVSPLCGTVFVARSFVSVSSVPEPDRPVRTPAGNALLNSPFDALVSAMAALAPPRMGQTTLLPAYQAALQPVIAANRVSAPCPPKPGAAALASSPPSLQKKSPEH